MTAMEIFTGTEDATIAKREGRKYLVRSALIILAIAIVASLPGWLPGRIYAGVDPRSVLKRMAVEYAGQRLAAGEIPLWNPNVGLGAPVIGDGHTGVFTPTILFHMVMPAKAAWVANAIVLMWLAGFGVVVLVVEFAPRIGSHSEPYAGALSEGLMFMAIAMCCRFLDLSVMNAMAMLPWVVLASGSLMNRISAGRLLGLTLLFLMVFLGADDAASVGVVFTCLIYLVWNFVRRPKQWAAFAGAVLTLLVSIAVAATVAAVQWMPAMDTAKAAAPGDFGFAARAIMHPSAIAPTVALAFALGSAVSVRRSRGISRKFLVWFGPIAPLGIAMMFNTGPAPRQEHLEAVKWIAQQNPGTHLRVLAEGNDSWQVPANALATAPGGPQRMRQWLKWVEGIDKNEITLRVEHPALHLLGSKYLITDRRMEPATRPATAPAPIPTRRLFGGGTALAPMQTMEWKPVWPATRPIDRVVVYENVSQPLPRFWVARNAQWFDRAQEIFDRLRNSDQQVDFDPHETVWLDREGEAESESGMLRRPLPGRGVARLELLEDSPERVRIGTQGAGGWLVLADAYAPGWTAKMSYTAMARGPRRGSARERTYEQVLPIVPAYGAMRAVPLVGGAEVIFEYEPKGWKNGLMVGGIGAIVLLLMIGGMLFPSANTGEASVAPNSLN